MSQAIFETTTNLPEAREHVVKFVGGAAAVTKVAPSGAGITVSYVATGRVKFTWSDTASNPGQWIGLKGYCFEATTPGDVKNFELVSETYSSTTRSVTVNLYESGTLADLAASEWCVLTFLFAETKGLF